MDRFTELNRQQIEARIPHRQPFIFLDRVTELEEGRRAIGWMDNPLEYLTRFGRHYAENLVMPASIWVEVVSEVLGVTIGLPPGKFGMLAELKEWEFKTEKLAGPVSITVVVSRLRSKSASGHGEVTVNNNFVAGGMVLGIFGSKDDLAA